MERDRMKRVRPIDLFSPTEEHEMLRKSVREFVTKEVEPQAGEYDRSEIFNIDLFKKLGDLGLLGVTVPEQYGGSGMGAIAVTIIHEELSASDPGFCLAYLAHSLLCANNLAINGDEAQKKKYLPNLCSGEKIGAMGMSEPDAGTDVLAMKTTAKKSGNDYVINGRKMWITNGTIDEGDTPCDLLLFYAQTDSHKKPTSTLSSFLVEGGTEGFSVGQKIMGKTGMRASNTAELCFDNCNLPKSQLIGKEGESIKHMMRNLEIERLGLAAMSVGIARRALEVMIRYANERKAFGKSITSFGQIQRYIGDSYAEYKAAKCYVYHIASTLDLTQSGTRIDSDAVKLVAAPLGKNIADRAMQVLGGYGYVEEYVVERLWRDAKLLEIGGGTLEAHQKNITKDLSKAEIGHFL